MADINRPDKKDPLLQDEKATLAWADEAPAEGPGVKPVLNTNTSDTPGSYEHAGHGKMATDLVIRRINYYRIALGAQFFHFFGIYLGYLFGLIRDHFKGRGMIDGALFVLLGFYLLLPRLFITPLLGFKYKKEPGSEPQDIPADVHYTNTKALIFINSLNATCLSLTLLFFDLPPISKEPWRLIGYLVAILSAIVSLIACTKATRITTRLVAANVPQNNPVNERGRRISIWDPLNAKVIIVDLVRS